MLTITTVPALYRDGDQLDVISISCLDQQFRLVGVGAFLGGIHHFLGVHHNAIGLALESPQGLEYHDGVAEICFVGHILGVGELRPVDVPILGRLGGFWIGTVGVRGDCGGSAVGGGDGGCLPPGIEGGYAVIVVKGEEDQKANEDGRSYISNALGHENLAYSRAQGIRRGAGGRCGRGAHLGVLYGCVSGLRRPK